METISHIVQSIQTSSPTLESDLNLLPISSVPSTSADKLLAHFLTMAGKNKSSLEIILNFFSFHRKDIDLLPTFQSLYLNFFLPGPVLHHIIQEFSFPPITSGVLYDLIKAGEDFEAELETFNLGLLKPDISERLIVDLLNVAFSFQNKPAVRTIISVFNSKRLDPLPALSYLFLNSYLSGSILRFVLNSFSERPAVDYYVDLLNMQDDELGLKLVSKLSNFLPELSQDEWILLHKMTDPIPDDDDEPVPEEPDEDEIRNPLLRTFFQTKIGETKKILSRPEWVRDYPEEIVPSYPDYIPSVHAATELLIQDMNFRGYDAQDKNGESIDFNAESTFKDLYITQYSISTPTEKIQMLEGIKELPPYDSTIQFREYGPTNTRYTLSVTEDKDACDEYGGCPMFHCTCFETMDQEGEEIDIMTIEEHLQDLDWFRGSCDLCLVKIPSRYYAVRLPLHRGGWKGCYCSFECMKEHIPDQKTSIQVGRLETQLKTIGIRDR